MWFRVGADTAVFESGIVLPQMGKCAFSGRRLSGTALVVVTWRGPCVQVCVPSFAPCSCRHKGGESPLNGAQAFHCRVGSRCGMTTQETARHLGSGCMPRAQGVGPTRHPPSPAPHPHGRGCQLQGVLRNPSRKPCRAVALHVAP